jgi:hypothetical protein
MATSVDFSVLAHEFRDKGLDLIQVPDRTLTNVCFATLGHGLKRLKVFWKRVTPSSMGTKGRPLWMQD